MVVKTGLVLFVFLLFSVIVVWQVGQFMHKRDDYRFKLKLRRQKMDEKVMMGEEVTDDIDRELERELE